MKKPDWWPQNPYFPEAMATIRTDDDYVKAIPDPALRTAVSWYLGNRFWELASDTIFEAMVGHQAEEEIESVRWSLVARGIRQEGPEEAEP